MENCEVWTAWIHLEYKELTLMIANYSSGKSAIARYFSTKYQSIISLFLFLCSVKNKQNSILHLLISNQSDLGICASCTYVILRKNRVYTLAFFKMCQNLSAWSFSFWNRLNDNYERCLHFTSCCFHILIIIARIRDDF